MLSWWKINVAIYGIPLGLLWAMEIPFLLYPNLESWMATDRATAQIVLLPTEVLTSLAIVMSMIFYNLDKVKEGKKQSQP